MTNATTSKPCETCGRESHARELMDSATRYGEAIERLQRERDNASAEWMITQQQLGRAKQERDEAQRLLEGALETIRVIATAGRNTAADLVQEREAHAATRRERVVSARDLQADRANVEVALEALSGRARELEGALEGALGVIVANRLVLGEHSGVREVGEIERRARTALAKGKP